MDEQLKTELVEFASLKANAIEDVSIESFKQCVVAGAEWMLNKLNKQSVPKTAHMIQWTEHERGWGQRPDGKSYHKTLEAASTFLEKNQCNGNSDYYTRGDRPKLVEISDEIATELLEKDIVWTR